MRDTVLATKPAAGSSTPAVDEFYWNLLPLDSTQPIERFRTDIVLDPELAAALTGSTRCYTGPPGSTDECDLQGPTTDGDAATFHVESGERPAGDGVTVAIGFEPGTVAQPLARTPDPVGDVAPFVAAAGAAGLSVGSWFAVWAFARRRRVATGIVVAQYDVPDSLPPLIAAKAITGAKDVIPAEIVHLAVRGNSAHRRRRGGGRAAPAPPPGGGGTGRAGCGGNWTRCSSTPTRPEWWSCPRPMRHSPPA